MSEFRAWHKIPRLNRSCIATEKIDGTNGAIIVEEVADPSCVTDDAVAVVERDGVWYGVYAQSRKRLLLPAKGQDNFGFAAWVQENALELTQLGPGYHYGEWWGSGIQRTYGLDHKRFSLFNAQRWHDREANGLGEAVTPEGVYVVPVLKMGTHINEVAEAAITLLDEEGSQAAPGWPAPEGTVVYHSAARQSFKVTVEGDEAAKGVWKGMHAQAEPEAAV